MKVSLVLAASGYMSGMDAVQQKTAQTGTEIEKLNQKRQAFTALGTAAAGFGAAAALGVGLAVSRFADFDQQMSYVSASTHETAANMDLLRDAALEAGARTVYSATEAAGAIEELAKAGVSTSDILSGGLDAALDLAAAGGLDVAQAAGIAATALKTFKLEGEDMSHVADLLAAGAGKAQGDVSQLSQALAQGGQVAKSTGLSTEETTGALSAFAAQGLLGSDAGTSFKSMLQRLTPQSNEAKREMERLGISAYDAGGNFVGLAEFAGNLKQSLQQLTPEQRNAAMATIFGSDAVRAATVLYDEGEAGIRQWISAVDDQGYAADTARRRLDNLKGDLEALGGAFDTVLIQSGSGANAALRDLVQTGTGLVTMFSGLPEPLIESVTYLGAAAAAVGLVGGAALLATPRIAEFRAIANAAGFSMKGLGLAAGAATLGLGVLIGVIATIAQQQAEARAKADAYADTLEKGTLRVTAATREMTKEALAANNSFLWMEKDSAFDAATKLGISLELVTDAAMGNAAALKELQKQIDEGADGSLAYANSAVDIENAVRGESASIEEAARAAAQKEQADGAAARAAEEHESALDSLSGAATGATFDVDELAAAIRGFGSANLDSRAAARELEQSVADLSASVAENGATLDITTQAGRDNQEALDSMATKALEVAAATAVQTQDQGKANEALAIGRQRLIESLAQFNITGAAAEAYADNLGLIPSNIPTWAQLYGVDEAEARLSWLSRERRAVISVVTDGAAWTPGVARPNATGNYYERGRVREFKAGGIASGIYPATPGGILKFAEAGHDEAFITMDPAYQDRSMQIWQEVGNRLGAFQSAPAYLAGSPQQTVVEKRVEVNYHGDMYSYDPTDLGRKSSEHLGRLLDASGF